MPAAAPSPSPPHRAQAAPGMLRHDASPGCCIPMATHFRLAGPLIDELPDHEQAGHEHLFFSSPDHVEEPEEGERMDLFGGGCACTLDVLGLCSGVV